MPDTRPLVDHLVETFAARGVRRIFGVPGGGSSLDLIRAAEARGIPFILARHETSAAIMALASGEIDGSLGVALTTIGPGLANAVNGMACATLDRSPLCLVSDGHAEPLTDFVTHQVFDQAALSAPIVKGHGRLEGDNPVDELESLLDLAQSPPYGAVHVELTGATARRSAPRTPRRRAEDSSLPAAKEVQRAQELLARAARPVVIVGLEACAPAFASAVRGFCDRLASPVLVTYKAKGVVPDSHPRTVGLFTGGALEAGCVGTADLLVLIGLDPVELIPQAWRYRAPVIDIGLAARPTQYVSAAVGLYGPLDATLEALGRIGAAGGWRADEAPALRAEMRAKLACSGGDGISPQNVIELALAAVGARPRPRITVDAGAHMFSATAHWECEAPRDLLISNGLSTMGFALPAAIGAALAEPTRKVVAFTGDAGLAMCLGELLTAKQQDSSVVVVVFNDGSLSLIDIKQQARALPPEGVRWDRPDFARVAEGFGLTAWTARTEDEYRKAIASALETDGPALVDVHVDPSGYTGQIRALRG
jgi:acetolactate synthase I/II/III large subunit